MEKAGNVFLRNRIVKVLKEINELNKQKVDRDIEKIENNVSFEEIFRPTKLDEITLKAENKKYELNLLISCSIYGFGVLDGFLKHAKEKMNEEEYTMFEGLINEIKNDVEKDIAVGEDIN